MKKILIVSFNDAGNEAQALRHIFRTLWIPGFN